MPGSAALLADQVLGGHGIVQLELWEARHQPASHPASTTIWMDC